MGQRDRVWRHPNLGRLTVGCLAVFLVFGGVGAPAAPGAPYRICVVGMDSTGQPVLPHGNISAPSGGLVRVGVWIDSAGGSADGIQSFDLVLCYDANVLTRLVVLRGAGLASGWEYFSYRCNEPGQIRLVGVADLPGGATPDPATFDPRGVIAGIAFQVAGESALVGTCTDVAFCSFTCGDNVLLSPARDSLYLPTGAGLTPGPEYDLNACLQAGGLAVPMAFVDFCPGVICITDSYTGCGDVNLNGIRGEIADIILFARFFLYGPSVFDPTIFPFPYPWEELDCDRDGHAGVSDLVMMIRMYLSGFPLNPGGALKPAPSASSAELTWSISDGALRIRTTSAAEIGGLRLTYRYSGYETGDASLSINSDMRVQSVASKGELRLLIYPDPGMENGMVPAGSHDLVTVPLKGNGTIELVGQEACDYAGGTLSLRASSATPREFGLLQNHPNPFNAGTVIPFRLKSQTDWTLAIYNVMGQVVRTFAGRNTAGPVQVEWDGTASAGTALATGVYFCRLDAAGAMSSTRILLLK